MFCKAVFFSLHLRQHWILIEPFSFSLQIIYTVRFVFHLCRVLYFTDKIKCKVSGISM